MQQKTILFDGRFLSLDNAGLGRYSSELFKNLLSLNEDFKFILLVMPATKFENELKAAIKKYEDSVEIIEFGAKHYSTAEQFKLRRLLNEINPDLVHFTNFNHPVLYKGKFVVTIHDLTLFQFSERAGKLKKIAYKYVINKAVRNAQKIFTVSEYAKKELIKKFLLSQNKVAVTYNGIDEKFKKITNPRALQRVEKYKLDKPYFLYVGQWRSHKNLLTLIHAYKKFIDDGYRGKIDLVFAGKVDPKYPILIQEVKKLNLTKEVKFIGFVPDEDLPVIYNNAFCFVFPSLSEGFGLPALEAQSCGVPVIASSATSLPEVLDAAALFFNPSDENALKRKMIELVDNDRLRNELILKGLENVKKFSWKSTAQKTLEVYKELLYK